MEDKESKKDKRILKMQRISSGSYAINKLLNGGYEKDIVTMIYGPSGSGKTNLCILAMVEQLKKNKKVIYIDSEGGFSIDRFLQIGKKERLLDDVFFLRPTTFNEQMNMFKKLKEFVKQDANRNIGLIIVDTISTLYRLEFGKKNNIDISRELRLQISYLNEISRKINIPIIVTAQVYSDFESEGVKPVGGNLIKSGSKCIIELKVHKINEIDTIREAILRKHRSLPEKSIFFKITNDGIEIYKRNKRTIK